MLTKILEAKGVAVSLKGEDIRVKTNAPLTEEQRAFLREYKSALVEELRRAEHHPDDPQPPKTPNSAETRDRIEEVIRRLVGEVLRFYGGEDHLLSCLGTEGLDFAIRDYLRSVDLAAAGMAADPLPGKPLQLAPEVTCDGCAHFEPNARTPTAGLGRCRIDAPASRRSPALWPSTIHRCRDWQAGKNDPGRPAPG